jgi:TldD protein
MPELNLPPAMEALRPELGSLVSDIEARAPYGAILLSAQQGLQIKVDSNEEAIVEVPPSAGSVLTAFDGEMIRERAIGGFDRSALAQGVNELVQSATFAHGRPIDPGPERRGDFITLMRVPPDRLATQDKLDRCRALQQRISKLDARIVNARVIYLDTSELSVFCNRTADLAQRVQRLYMLAFVFVADSEGNRRYNFISKTATAGWEALIFTDEELQGLVDNAIGLLSAERIEPGEYTVVTAPGVSGTICHESFGHGVETDMFLKERAKAAHFIDKVVGSPLVNIWDNPSHPSGYGTYFFDDEGLLAGPTQMVENGVFRRGITDLYSASALNIPRSANGRRQDFSRKAYARMSNTYFGAGQTPVADLFAQVDHGIYLQQWSSGMEDPQGWGIQVTCHYGREIKNGQVTNRMFAPIGVSGYVPDVLQSVTAVGNEWWLDGGRCGKGHKEIVFVSSGGPHLLLKARLG